MQYTVEIDAKAAKEIKAFPKVDPIRILKKIERLASNPRPPGCVKLEGNSALWRTRLGMYRIVYQIKDAVLTVTIVKVGNRREVYRGL